jgi:hypothetical protein
MEIGELDVQTVGERERHIHNVDHINIYACLIVYTSSAIGVSVTNYSNSLYRY